MRRLLAAPVRLVRALRSPERRALLWLRLFARGAVHQTTALTGLDRYPEIFGEVARLLGDRARPRLLSFGCSTGEEAVTLRRYLPAADIVGAELNPHSLRVARRLPAALGVRFVRSTRAAIAAAGPYDAIFCMAVLQRTPHLVADRGISDIAALYPFEKFAEQVAALDAVLTAGGLLVIEHSQYAFADTPVAARYAPAPFRTSALNPGPRFGPDGRRRGTAAGAPVIFVKRR